ncbi:MAG: phosphatidylglycerol lysyltransferase domain-containing protein [Dysgonamonadaceae bacterium]|jgi:hypothetical protein|nr:phosphatidylglycerol lysyltransferase domain-containing protein [Dysgonamonadaceae bacterium]
MMINFHPVRIEDRDLINEFFFKSTYRNCDFSFSNILCWKHKYDTTFAIIDGFLLIRFFAEYKEPGYMMPLGAGDLKKAINLLRTDAKTRGDRFNLYAVTPEMFAQIEAACPGEFRFETDKAWSEYIYDAQDLITLTGKKFQPKRNHINKFKKTYDYEYLPITRKIIPNCLDLYYRWCEENSGCLDASLVEERHATQKAFHYFEKLGLKGGAIRIAGEIVAYSYGQQLSPDTFGVHAEKSLYEIDGGFSAINQMFAEHECRNYKYINREEDLGIESLRKSKESYHPVMLLEKGFVEEVNAT